MHLAEIQLFGLHKIVKCDHFVLTPPVDIGIIMVYEKVKGSYMKIIRKHISILLCFLLLISSVTINGLFVFASDEPTHTGVVATQTDPLRVREGPGGTYNMLGLVAKGASVTIYGAAVDGTDGYKWYKIAYGSGFGYVNSYYIGSVKEIPKYDYNADFETNLTAQGFPESYKVLLRRLHAQHPNWIFTADNLSMTWETAVASESTLGKSLVAGSSKASWKSMMKYAYNWDTGEYVSYDSGGWVTAEREVVEFYMEPRNFLNENYIYMFLDQTYNPNIQNKEGLQKILNGTFMEGAFPEETHATYADVIMEAAQQSGVSPYVLAASIIIEQGVQGQGGSISGNISGYEGYYNYFNIRAYASGGYDAVTYGLMYAAGSGSLGRPWNTRAKSIIGGAQHYANGYVKRGQDTLYYKKWNVITPTYYINQYMTNVQGAYLETSKLKNAYSTVNADAQLTFAIPVYRDMPEKNNTSLPTSTGANNYYLTALSVDGASVANFDMYVNEYEMIVPAKTSQINVAATAVSGASVSGTGNIKLNTGMNKVPVTVTAASGKKATYTISVYREEGAADEPQIPEPTIEGSYNISTFVSGITPGTSVADFIAKFNVKNGTTKIINSAGSEKTSGNIATGDKVVIYNNAGEQKLVYNIVIFGDVNGDGKIGVVDLASVRKHLLEVTSQTGVYYTAMDTNHDGRIGVVDLANVRKHLLEVIQIVQ